MTIQIATWNVNSVRTRLEQVQQWLGDYPELTLLCLQETKVIDGDFPRAALESLGFYVYCYGQKSYNGVALVSRVPLSAVYYGFGAFLPHAHGWDDQKRVMATTIGEVVVVNLYVPNGSSVGSEKYTYKLQWLAILYEYLEALIAQHATILLCGDFNVALEDIDIHDPTDRDTQVMATESERLALQKILSLGFGDVLRKFHSEGGIFSWWDYRAAAFRRNLGWRIDYHFASPPLYDRAVDCRIDATPRGWKQPSDHAPVIVTFAP